MIPIIAPIAAVAVEGIAGFAAAAAAAITPEVLIAGISGAALVAKTVAEGEAAMAVADTALATTIVEGETAMFVAEQAAIQAAKTAVAEQATAQAVKTSFGAAIAPWVGGVLLAGTILYGGYKIIKHLKGNKAGRPITQEEFSKTLKNGDIIEAIRRNLKENASQYNMTEYQLYSSTIDTICGNPAYKNISDDDKIILAARLTNGLL